MTDKKIPLLQRLRKNAQRVLNVYLKLTDPSFRSFVNYESKVLETDKVKRLEKLRYMARIDIATTGVINPGLKERLRTARSLNELIAKDQKIVQVGRLKIYDKNAEVSHIVMGTDRDNGRTLYSSSKADNIPIWQDYRPENIINETSLIYPVNAKGLHLTNRYFEDDIALLDKAQRSVAKDSFKKMVSLVHSSNPKLATSVQTITEKAFLADDYNKALPIKIGSMDNRPYIVSDKSDNYVILRPYLEPQSDTNVKILSLDDFSKRLENDSITVFAHCKQGVDLGLRNNKLYIRAQDNLAIDGALKKWMPFDRFIKHRSVPVTLKHKVVAEVIQKKDFLVESTKKTFPLGKRTVVLKEHYARGETFVALVEDISKSDVKQHYIPIEAFKKKLSFSDRNDFEKKIENAKETVNRTAQKIKI